MIAKIYAFTLLGLEALPVEVEAGVYNGLPDLTVVGLPDTVLRESRERVRSAIVSSGYQWPSRRMLVNLAPAHLRKEGSGLDLAVAVSLLKASGQLPGLDTGKLVFAGELSLDGTLRGSRGILPAALSMELWPEKILVVPAVNQEEAGQGSNRTLALSSLSELRNSAGWRRRLQEVDQRPFQSPKTMAGPATAGLPPPLSIEPISQWDLSMVIGQNKARRSLELAAAGSHNLLLLGPPGSGKSLLAKCLQGILPPLGGEEMLEVNRIYSAAGLLTPDMPWISRRPFRNPHASVTRAGLLGGGNPFRPGETSLAHQGVLFIDELPEMNRGCLESLRQPLEEGTLTISRSWGSITLPAKIQLVASANLCPCGYFGDRQKKCRCRDDEIRRYQNRFSGPLLDRMDIIVNVPRLEAASLHSGSRFQEPSAAVAARVAAARQKRQTGVDRGEYSLEKLQQQLTKAGRVWALGAYEDYQLTARGYYRLLLLARTIADLAGEEGINAAFLAEALEYRRGPEGFSC
ncbi:MAG: YifB family Mg chelatase-like AAA ATPase [Clostridiales bacterium]